MKKNSSNQKSQKFYNQLIQKSVDEEGNNQISSDIAHNISPEFNVSKNSDSVIYETKKNDTLALISYF